MCTHNLLENDQDCRDQASSWPVKELGKGRAGGRSSPKPGLVQSDSGGIALQRDQVSRNDFVAIAVEEETLDLWSLGGLKAFLTTMQKSSAGGPRFGSSPGTFHKALKN